jgi:hypothetical protein
LDDKHLARLSDLPRDFLILQSGTVPVKDRIAAPKNHWLKTPFSNLMRYVPSGIYFARIRVRGKLIRRSLKTNAISVAKLRLAEIEKTERQRIEIEGAVTSGNMRFGEALAIFGTACSKMGRSNHAASSFARSGLPPCSTPGPDQSKPRFVKSPNQLA